MNVPAREAFAARLNEARIEKHLSINQLARVAGVPKATAQGWLNGTRFPQPALRPQYLRLIEELGLSDELPEGLWLNNWAEIKPRLREGRSPYLGLRQFGVGDVEYYWGRSAEARRLAVAVSALHEETGHGIVALVGPSGCGKSSLLAAGIAGGESVTGVLAGWSVRSVGRDDLVGEVPAADLLVFDQLEETLFLPEEQRRPVIAGLGRAAASHMVLVGLRSDAFAAAEAEPIVAEALSRPVLVAPLTRAELREVIVQPAALAGVDVDDDLVHVLLNDLAPGSDEHRVPADVLPLLSNALMVTWAAGAGERMTLADYRKVGGVAGAVEALAEQVYTDLATDSRAVAQQLFLRLVGVTQETVVPRSLRLGDLEVEPRRVVDAFVAARMLTIDNDRVRISHEALLRHWARLAGWIAEHRADLDSVAKLRRAAELWRDTERDPNVLIPVHRLPMFAEWLDDPDKQTLLGTTEREFLAASEEHFASALDEERVMSGRLRRHRGLALGLAVVTTVAAAGAAVGFIRGEDFRRDAVTARNEAQSRQIATAARDLRSKSPNLEAQLAVVANTLADTQEARSAVIEAASIDVPIRRLGKPGSTLAVSPDGSLVARADGAGSVTLWRGAQLTRDAGTAFTVDDAGGALLSVALTNVGGRSVLAVAGSGVRSLWDVTAEPVKLADLDPSGATAAAFNTAGDRVVFGDAKGGATVYDITSLNHPVQVASVRSSKADIQTGAVALDPAGTLYVAGVPGEVNRWRISTTPVELAPLPVSVAGPEGRLPVRAQALALSADGTQLAAGLAGHEVARWRIESDGEAHAGSPLTGFADYINGVAFSPDATSIAVASSDQSVAVFCAADGSIQRKVVAASLQTSVGFAESGHLVSAGNDGNLLVWPVQSPLWKRSGAVVYNLSTDGTNWLAGGSSTDGIALWRLGDAPRRMPKPVAPTLAADDYQVGAAAVAPNGGYLLGSSMKGRVLSWPLTGSGAGTGRAYDAGIGVSVIFVAISPDSSLVAAMSARASEVILFRADPDGSLARLASVSVNVPQLVGFSADGRLMAIADADKAVSLWSVADPGHPSRVGAIAALASIPSTLDMAPVSARIAVGESSGRVSLWDISNPAEPTETRSWTDAGSDVYSLEFSPDELRLIGTSGDDVVWSWRLDSPATQADSALNGDIGRPWDVRFLDDGRRFAGSGDLGAVRIWDATPALAVADLCSRIGDPLTAEEWKRYLPGVEPRPVC